MTRINIKTNSQFPGRKKRETNVISPMRTDMSVVSQSDMYEGTNMSNKSRRMSNFFVRISIVLCVLAICCCLSLIMGCVDLFHAMLGKIGLSLGGRALSVLFF